MKTLLLSIVASLCLIANLSADYSFVDDAPKGFVHVRSIENNERADYYIRTNKIASIEIFIQEIDDKKVPSIRIRTVALDTYRGDDTLRNISYYLNFEKREEAEKCARRIMELMTEAEQVGAERPASDSKSRSRGKEKSEPKSDRRSK